MLTEVKRNVHEQSKNFNKNKENSKKHQIEIMELRNPRAELESSLEGFNSRLYQAEERVCELKNKSLEMIQSEEQNEKE